MIRFDLTFHPDGSFAGPGVFRSYPRYNPGPAYRTQIRGFGRRLPDGTILLKGAALVDESRLFFPVLRLSTANRRRRLEGRGSLALDPPVGPDELLAAARSQKPAARIEDSKVGASLEWVDEGAWALRQQSAADLARDRLRARVRRSLRAAIPAGSRLLRTCVGTSRDPASYDWIATATATYALADEEADLTLTAKEYSGKDALRAILSQLGARLRARNLELLSAVLAAPEEDAPRLAYASWLKAQGDPRGEFIEIQIALARDERPGQTRLPDDERSRLQERERALLDANAQLWCEPYEPSYVRFHRGFVEHFLSVEEDDQFFGDDLLSREPVVALSIGDGWPRCDQTAFSFRSLDVSACCYGPNGLVHLLTIPLLANLTHLDVSATYIIGDDIVSLTNSPRLGRLTALDAGYNYLYAPAAIALAGWPRLASLTSLGLPFAHIGTEGAGALAGSPLATNLTRLDLRGNDIDTNGAMRLAESPHLKNLTALDLRDNAVDEHGASALRARFPFVQLDAPGGGRTEGGAETLWRLLEEAWSRFGPEFSALRASLAARDLRGEAPRLGHLLKVLPRVLVVLEWLLAKLERADRLAIHQAIDDLVRALYRDDLLEVIKGSDDGFEVRRGFIVAMGRPYYEAVSARPELGVEGAECQGILSVVQQACELLGEEDI